MEKPTRITIKTKSKQERGADIKIKNKMANNKKYTVQANRFHVCLKTDCCPNFNLTYGVLEPHGNTALALA